MAMLDQGMLSQLGPVNALELQQKLGPMWQLPLGGGGMTLGNFLQQIFGGGSAQSTTTPNAAADGAAGVPTPGGTTPPPMSVPGSMTATPDAMQSQPPNAAGGLPTMGVPDLIRSLGQTMSPVAGAFERKDLEKPYAGLA